MHLDVDLHCRHVSVPKKHAGVTGITPCKAPSSLLFPFLFSFSTSSSSTYSLSLSFSFSLSLSLFPSPSLCAILCQELVYRARLCSNTSSPSGKCWVLESLFLCLLNLWLKQQSYFFWDKDFVFLTPEDIECVCVCVCMCVMMDFSLLVFVLGWLKCQCYNVGCCAYFSQASFYRQSYPPQDDTLHCR